jgi:hypothetical protein
VTRPSRAAGIVASIQAGVPHGLSVGAVASRKLNLYAPAAMVGYFDELAEATRSRDVDPAALTDIAVRYSKMNEPAGHKDSRPSIKTRYSPSRT